MRGRNTTEKTIQEYRGILTKLVDFLEDRSIELVTRPHLMGFREMLKTYPARPTLVQRRLGLKALIDLGLKPALGHSTIAKHLDRVSQLMMWAERSGYEIKASMAQGLQPKSTTKENEERDRYSLSDLTTLFATAQYQGEAPFNRTAFYWAPLIALYTGMRLDEICQLRIQDIYLDQETNLHAISINDEGEDRKLKNKSSPRIIPLHSQLVRLGLLEYVKVLRSNRHRMLFPTLNRHPKNGYSHAVSKWFSTYKTDLGFDRKKVFHSFRHTVADHLKQELKNPEIVDAILGHASKGSENHRRYGKDYRLDLMKPVIEALNFNVPAVPFGSLLLVDTEKAALRSAKTANALRDRRRNAKANASDDAAQCGG